MNSITRAFAICGIAMLYASGIIGMMANEKMEVRDETKNGYTSHSPIYIN